jgi:cholest-4-en-3-one 26-monooxygenase
VQLSDVDLNDPDNFVAGVPHEMFEVLRREAPVYRHPDQFGHYWCVTRHADLVEMNRNAKVFSSNRGGTNIPEQSAEDLVMTQSIMLNMDPPDHTKMRKIVNTGFTPRRIRELEQILRTRAATIIDEVAERGSCEFVEEVAAELPLQAIADFLGVPQSDRKLLFELSNNLIGFDDPEFAGNADSAMDAAGQMFVYAQQMADEHRANPRDDIVSDLLAAEVDGERLDDMGFNLFFMLLAVAGNETTRNSISHGMLALMEHPDQRKKLLDDPALLDSAVEEILRWGTPVMHFRRTATEATEIGGQAIEEGDRVVMWHISANRDEAVFDDPYVFDIQRGPNPHLMHVAFGGGGPHFCLGANLARAEMRVMFDEILRRLPDMELAGPVDRLRSNFINGIKRIPVEFTPTPRTAP